MYFWVSEILVFGWLLVSEVTYIYVTCCISAYFVCDMMIAVDHVKKRVNENVFFKKFTNWLLELQLPFAQNHAISHHISQSLIAESYFRS